MGSHKAVPRRVSTIRTIETIIALLFSRGLHIYPTLFKLNLKVDKMLCCKKIYKLV